VKDEKYVGVIGLGNISERHRENIRKLFPWVKIIVMSASGRKIDLKDIANADELVSEIEILQKYKPWFVIDASPASYHYHFSSRLLKMNIPVLTEKPLAESFSKGKKLLNVQKLTNTLGAVGYCFRFDNSFLKFKEIIQSKDNGKILNVDIFVGQALKTWRQDKNYIHSVSARKELGGGALLELSHELDYCLSVFGKIEIVNPICRSSDENNLKVEDLVDFFAITDRDEVIYIHLDMVTPFPRRQCRVLTEKCEITWNILKRSVTYKKIGFNDHVYDFSHETPNTKYLSMLEAFVSLVEGERHHNFPSYSNSCDVLQLIDNIKAWNK